MCASSRVSAQRYKTGCHLFDSHGSSVDHAVIALPRRPWPLPFRPSGRGEQKGSSMRRRSSIFAAVAGPRAKWIVFGVWFVVIAWSGILGVPEKYTDAQQNESTSFLPGDAESTKALLATEDLQGGELAPAVILYRRESGLTAADKQKIVDDVGRLTERRFPGVVADGATAAAGGGDAAAGGPPPTEGCGGPTTAIPGQPDGYAPFVGPVCSPDGKAALVFAYVRGDGESATLLDPVAFWRETVSDPGGGLEVKITGGAGYAADAIEVFENINGTLLGVATLLVVILLILIYRSPIFLFIPLASVIFAEFLSQTLGYALAEAGVTINGQSSAIMSILVLGAGTDYALLIVARYREEMHREVDKYVAMRNALISAGPAVFASAATVIAALFCLSIARVNGTSGLGPLGALGVFCAALSMLTLLPALLLIFGRRAFWPFVPHTPTTRPTPEGLTARGQKLIAGLQRRRSGAGGRRVPDRVRAAPVDHHHGVHPQGLGRRHAVGRVGARRAGVHPVRAAPRPARAPGRRDARLLEARRRPRRRQPGADLPRRRGDPARDVPRADVLLDRPDDERGLPHRGRVGRGPGVAGQELPGRIERADRHHRRRSRPTSRRCRRRSPTCPASRR